MDLEYLMGLLEITQILEKRHNIEIQLQNDGSGSVSTWSIGGGSEYWSWSSLNDIDGSFIEYIQNKFTSKEEEEKE